MIRYIHCWFSSSVLVSHREEDYHDYPNHSTTPVPADADLMLPLPRLVFLRLLLPPPPPSPPPPRTYSSASAASACYIAAAAATAATFCSGAIAFQHVTNKPKSPGWPHNNLLEGLGPPAPIADRTLLTETQRVLGALVIPPTCAV